MHYEADVIESELPLFISKKELKQAKFKLDTSSDSAQVFGRTVSLTSTSSGHYLLPLFSFSMSLQASATAFVTSDTKNFVTSRELKKFHKQFGHCSPTALSRLLASAKYKFSKRELYLCLEQLKF